MTSITDPTSPDYDPFAGFDNEKLRDEVEHLEGELNFYKPMFIW